MTRCKNRTRC